MTTDFSCSPHTYQPLFDSAGESRAAAATVLNAFPVKERQRIRARLRQVKERQRVHQIGDGGWLELLLKASLFLALEELEERNAKV